MTLLCGSGTNLEHVGGELHLRGGCLALLVLGGHFVGAQIALVHHVDLQLHLEAAL